MNINSLYGNVGTTPTANVDGINPSTSTPASIAPAALGAASATISSPAQFLSEMQQLSQSNPAQFKAVAAQVATSFQNAASQASGPEAKVLNGLANQFNQAAQTGSLQAPQGATPATAAQGPAAGQNEPHHHHHHHGGGGGAGGMSSAVDQAFQSAMSILTQTTGASSSTAATSSSSSST